MTNNELLLAMSELMDKKIEPLSKDIRAIKLDIENDVKPAIRLLAENYMPAAKRYESETNKINAIETDIKLIKKVVRDHSDKLERIS